MSSPRRSRGSPAARPRRRRRSASRCCSVERVYGVSRGTTTSGRRSLSVTSAARCSRSLDRPSAMPATDAVEAGTTTMPSRRVRPARRPGAEVAGCPVPHVVADVAAEPASEVLAPVRVAERQAESRPAGSAGRRARRRGRRARPRRAAPLSTARVYGVPDAPETPTTHGALIVIAAARARSGRRARTRTTRCR